MDIHLEGDSLYGLKMIRVMNWLIDNIYVTFGDDLFRQVIEIPMGADCGPFLANLFLYSYEFKGLISRGRLENIRFLGLFEAVVDILTIF